MKYTVDVQGFKRAQNEFIFKELAIIPLEEDVQPCVYLFQPPHDWNFLAPRYKCENNWLTRNYHGINWQDGEIPYEEFETVLRSALIGAREVYVKGLEKQRWLKNFLKNVENLETLGCPSLTKLCKISDEPCSNHDLQICFKSHCAARNVLALKKWLLNFYDDPAVVTNKETEKESENSDLDY